jgi:polyisoprenoid-binding protein YceI
MLQSPDSDVAPKRRRRWFSPKWVIGGIGVLVALLVGGPWLWIHVIESKPPAKLSLSSDAAEPATSTSVSATSPAVASSPALASSPAVATSPAAASSPDVASSPAAASSAGTSAAASAGTSAPAGGKNGSLNGQWTVGPNSVAGYRVQESYLGQKDTAVGRTQSVTGDLAVSNNAVTSATFEVDLTTVKSGASGRDDSFNYTIMDTPNNPKATFKSTAPIAVPAVAAAGKKFTAKVTGDLTLHGATKPVTFTVTGRKSAAGFEVTAQIPLVWDDFGISVPRAGPGIVDAKGTLEVLLKLTPKG